MILQTQLTFDLRPFVTASKINGLLHNRQSAKCAYVTDSGEVKRLNDDGTVPKTQRFDDHRLVLYVDSDGQVRTVKDIKDKDVKRPLFVSTSGLRCSDGTVFISNFGTVYKFIDDSFYVSELNINRNSFLGFHPKSATAVFGSVYKDWSRFYVYLGKVDPENGRHSATYEQVMQYSAIGRMFPIFKNVVFLDENHFISVSVFASGVDPSKVQDLIGSLPGLSQSEQESKSTLARSTTSFLTITDVRNGRSQIIAKTVARLPHVDSSPSYRHFVTSEDGKVVYFQNNNQIWKWSVNALLNQQSQR